MSASNRCSGKLAEGSDKRDLIEIKTLIDLTDKPIGLTRDEIGWSRVKSNASNCICCCNNNSITLVTTNNSYILDHIPLDNIQFAQTNSSLQYLALSNHRKLVVIDLADNDEIKCDNCNSNRNKAGKPKRIASETKIVNLSAQGLTIGDVIYWRWINESTLAILSLDALYTCNTNQPYVSHPAYTAITTNRTRYLSLEREFDNRQYLGSLYQVTNIQQDLSQNFFAISSLYSTSSLVDQCQFNQQPTNTQLQASTSIVQQRSLGAQTLKSSFGSMPSRLSHLANNDHQSSDHLPRSEHSFEFYKKNFHQLHASLNSSSSSSSIANVQLSEDEVRGLIQVHCKMRNRSQLIQAHAITFTNPNPPNYILDSRTDDDPQVPRNPTILVAANKIGDQMRVYFIEMASSENHVPPANKQNSSPMIRFNRLSRIDFPTSIVCSHVLNEGPQSTGNSQHLHVALITTKHGQLFVCSVAHSTILFNTQITPDVISSTVLEDNTQGLMVICRNGRVLLVKLKLMKIMKLLEESKTLRHISSLHNMLLNASDIVNNNNRIVNEEHEFGRANIDQPEGDCPKEVNLEVLISTKL